MFELSLFAAALGVLLLFGFAGWLISLGKRDVSIVDSLWSIMILLALVVYAVASGDTGPRTALVLVLASVWALRLSAFITWRNWGEPEDHRYQAIRKNNDPGFAFKSLYIVFGLQATLAAVVSLPLLAAVVGETELGYLAAAGVVLWVIGFGFEAVGDWQLAAFRRRPGSRGRVMDRGLWRYTRHPNYFGEFCIWWGFYLIALDAGGWWSFVSPVLMTVLLLKVSGVSLLEQGMAERRPGYRDYIARTNAFFPGRPKTSFPSTNGGVQDEPST